MTELWIVLQGRPQTTKVGDTRIAGMPDEDLTRLTDYAGMLPCFTSEHAANRYADQHDPRPGVVHVVPRNPGPEPAA